MKYLEAFLEWGGIKREIICLVLGGISLIISIFDLIHGRPLFCVEYRLFWKR